MKHSRSSAYIASERARGVNDEDIESALLDRGWDANHVSDALAASSSHTETATDQHDGVLADTRPPLSIGDLLFVSFFELFSHVRQVIPIMVPPVLLMVVGAFGAAYFTDPEMSISRLFAAIASIAGQLIFFLAMISLMIQIRDGWMYSSEEAYARSVRYIIPVFWVSCLSGLLVLGGSFLILIPGVIMLVWVAFAVPSVVIDEQRGFRALNYSREIVRGNWLPVFWKIMTVLLLTSFLTLTFNSIPYFWILSPFVTLPFLVIYMTHLYENIRTLTPVSIDATPTNSMSLMKRLTILGAILFPFVAFAFWGLVQLLRTFVA